jgi:hypothetical protein
MPRSISCRTAVMILACLGASTGWAADPSAGENAATASPESAPIAAWIKQLNSDRFTERTEASKRLEAAGMAAFPSLAEAATGENREVSLRAIEVLRKHFEQGGQATKDAAKQALQKIAGSQHESAAQRAKEVLNPPQPETPVAPGIRVAPGIPGFQILPQLQIQVQAAGGGMTRQIRVNNGVKEIEASEHGGKTKITEDPNQGIKIEVAETKDGKETKRTYAAKNAEDLKKNHPEGYRLYEKYTKQQGGFPMQVQIAGGVPLGGGMQAARPLAEKSPKPVAVMALKQAQHLVENAVKQLERAQPSSGKPEDLGQARKRLEEIAKQLEEERAKLEK